MKKSKENRSIIETSMGKFLLQARRPPIPLRSSPRKVKTKLKKEIKRLDEQIPRKKKTKKIERIKRKIRFQDENCDEKSSILLLVSQDDEKEITDEELINWKCNLCFVNSSSRSALIFAPRASRLTIEGIFAVEQLFGPLAFLHGYRFQLGQRYSIFNLSSQSLISIENGREFCGTSFNDEEILSFFTDYQIPLKKSDNALELIEKTLKIHRGFSVFFIEQIQTNWIESMKSFSPNDSINQWIFRHSPQEKINAEQEENNNEETKGFQQLWNGLGVFRDSFYHSVVYSDEIRSITEEILGELRGKTSSSPLIIFVCGAKDSGKSTYLRYLINQCLNERNVHMKLSFLDCDIGQSEFTPSGSISLIHHLTEPLFGPSASHLKKPFKSFYFGNIQVTNEQILSYLNTVRTILDSMRHLHQDLLLVNTMGWSSDNGLVIMKELIDLIQPNLVLQLRSSSPHFRHTMPDLDSNWSKEAPLSLIYRENHQLPMYSLYDHYKYHLLLTPVRQHNTNGKSHLTRRSCLWSYFSQIETKQLLMKPLIDYSDRIEIFPFHQCAVGLLNRQVQAKYLLQVLNASIVALCRVKQEMLYRLSNSYPALIDAQASLECLGYGFVRSIDMIRHEIHVIIPDRQLSKSLINAFVKGNDDCPEEFYFMSIDRWRGSMPPYVTGIINSNNG